MNATETDLLIKQARKGKVRVKIVELKMVRESSAEYESAVYNVNDVLKMMKPFFNRNYREMAVVIGLNTANIPCVIHTVGCGNPCSSPVYVGNVFKPLLLSNASSFILLHNHPASTLNPSQCDKEITSRLKDAGKLLEVEMTDHVIIDADCEKCFSFRNQGLL